MTSSNASGNDHEDRDGDQRPRDWLRRRQMFLDAKVSYNNTHFPLYQKTDLQPLTDQSNNNALYRNRNSSQIMYRRRAQVIA
jgi:hypothetical protein